MALYEKKKRKKKITMEGIKVHKTYQCALVNLIKNYILTDWIDFNICIITIAV